MSSRPPSVKTATLHDEQRLPRVQLDVHPLQHPGDVQIDLQGDVAQDWRTDFYLVLAELRLNEDNDGLQNWLAAVKLDLESLEETGETNREQISRVLVPVRVVFRVKVVKLVDKLGEGEHDLAKLLVVDVGVHGADHEEQQEGDLVRRVQAVDDEVADPGKIEKKAI